MFSRHRASTTDLWKMTHGPEKGPRAFIKKFKIMVSKVLVADQISVDELSNALLIYLPFC